MADPGPSGRDARRWAAAAAAAALVALAGVRPAAGEPWSAAFVRALPDDAFAAVEVGPDGRRIRHLPHHDAEGRVDPGHLRSALARLGQVRWLDPATAAAAARHLREHARGR